MMKEKEQQLFNEWSSGEGIVDLREFLLSDPKRKLLENVEQDCQVVLLPGTSRQKPEYPK